MAKSNRIDEDWLADFRRRISAGSESIETLATEAKLRGYNPLHVTAYIYYTRWLQGGAAISLADAENYAFRGGREFMDCTKACGPGNGHTRVEGCIIFAERQAHVASGRWSPKPQTRVQLSPPLLIGGPVPVGAPEDGSSRA